MKKSILLLLVLSIISCKNQNKTSTVVSSEETETTTYYNDIRELEWLLGNWNGTDTDMETHENWTRVNDSTLTLFGYSLVGKDTVFGERVTLQQSGGETYFTVKDILKKDAPLVPFRMSSCEGGVAVFENKDNPFPQKIIYHKPQKDTLYARIEGQMDGAFQKVDFYFTK